jgi:DNA-binding MarR family transcriptional regulator
MTSPSERPTPTRPLNDDATRLAAALAGLSLGGRTSGDAKIRPSLRPPTPELVADVIRLRRFRSTLLAKDLFADPAWDLLLFLLHKELTHKRVAVSELGEMAGVPLTTTLRWLATLADHNFVVRVPDVHDSRRVLVHLAPSARGALYHFFAELRATFRL